MQNGGRKWGRKKGKCKSKGPGEEMMSKKKQ